MANRRACGSLSRPIRSFWASACASAKTIARQRARPPTASCARRVPTAGAAIRRRLHTGRQLLHQETGETRQSEAAPAANRPVRQTISLDGPEDISGGVKGDYARCEYPNWASKFFVDSRSLDLAFTKLPSHASAVRFRRARRTAVIQRAAQMRDLIVTAIVTASLPFCFLRPWVGILVWSWLSYMNPHRYAFGFAYSLPFAQMVAVATLAGMLFDRTRQPLPRTLPVVLLATLWVTFVASTSLAAINPKDAWGQLSEVSKILLMTFLTLVLFQDRERLRWLVVVIALSIGFHGAKAGLWTVLTGTHSRVWGPPGTFIGDNNDLALALNMVLPLFILLRREETRRWVRHGLLAAFLLSVIGVLMTYSRGGFLGLAVVLPLIFLKGPGKVAALLLLALATPSVISMLPEQWFDRMRTIADYQQDGAANARFTAWRVAWGLAKDYPLLGAGFKPFTEESYNRYAPDYHVVRDAHSIVFQMLAEQGFLGLAEFLALLATTILALRRLIRQFTLHPTDAWIHDWAQMLEAGLAGYVVSGLFVGRAYFDLFYHFVAITTLLTVLANQLTHTPMPASRVANV